MRKFKMAGRPKLDRPRDPQTVPGRICILLDKIWEGSQAAMAADLDLRPATISNVLNRRRAPGRLMMERLAAHPRVNGKWLTTGKGTPLRVESDAECRMVPVASRLLPGPPARYAAELTQQSLPVLASDFHPNLYFVVADRSICDVPVLAGLVDVGDKILFDADLSRWLQSVKVRDDKPCVIVRGRGKHPLVELQAVRCRRLDGEKCELLSMKPSTAVEDSGAKEPYWKQHTAIQLDPVPYDAPIPATITESQMGIIPLKCIAAVAIQVIHNF